MFVLGIDPGLTRMGYGLIGRNKSGRTTAAGVLRTSRELPVAQRLAELHRDLTELITEYEPDVVAVEAVFTNRNLRTALSVSRASGMAFLAAAQAGVPVVEYTPTAIKLAVTGDGTATKAMVAEMVVRRLKLAEAPKPADAADALAVALCHLQSLRIKPVRESA